MSLYLKKKIRGSPSSWLNQKFPCLKSCWLVWEWFHSYYFAHIFILTFVIMPSRVLFLPSCFSISEKYKMKIFSACKRFWRPFLHFRLELQWKSPVASPKIKFWKRSSVISAWVGARQNLTWVTFENFSFLRRNYLSKYWMSLYL